MKMSVTFDNAFLKTLFHFNITKKSSNIRIEKTGEFINHYFEMFSFIHSNCYITEKQKIEIENIAKEAGYFLKVENTIKKVSYINLNAVDRITYEPFYSREKEIRIVFKNGEEIFITKRNMRKINLLNQVPVNKIYIDEKLLKNIMRKEQYLQFIIRKEL